jgi:hypothetical protein
VAAAACSRQLHTPARRAARSLGAVPHMDVVNARNRMVYRNIVCSAATATKEETFTYQAEVGRTGLEASSRTASCPSHTSLQQLPVKPSSFSLSMP